MLLNDISSSQLKAIPNQSILLLPVACLEQFGPALPMNSNQILVERLAKDVTSHLKSDAPEQFIVTAPTFAYLPPVRSDLASGGIITSPNIAREMFTDLLRAYVEKGFKTIMILSMDHTIDTVFLLRNALDHVHGKSDCQIFEPGSAFHYQGMNEVDTLLKEMNLDPIFEVHADVKLHSMLLYLDEKSVAKNYQDLPPCRINVQAKSLTGQRTLTDIGASDGYVGSPGLADFKLGKKLYKIWRNLFSKTLIEVIDGGKPPDLPMLIRLSNKLL